MKVAENKTLAAPYLWLENFLNCCGHRLLLGAKNVFRLAVNRSTHIYLNLL